MLALYRSGRQADALRAYQDARDVLVEEPASSRDPSCAALEDRILAQDPELGWTAPAGSVARAAGRRRVAERDVRRSCARARPTPAPAREVQTNAGRLALVSGEPGIGKTRLCEGARRPRSRRAHERRVGARAGRATARRPSGRGCRSLRTLAWRRRRKSFPRQPRAPAPTSRVSSLISHVSSPAPMTRPTPRPRGSVSSRRWPRSRGTCRRVQPLVIVLDDLHWADQSSLRLLEFVVTALQRSAVYIIGTFREAEARTPPLANTLATLAAHAAPRTAHARRSHARRGRRLRRRSDGATPTRPSPTRCTTAPPATPSSSANWCACSRTKAVSTARACRFPSPCPKVSGTCCERGSHGCPTKRRRC